MKKETQHEGITIVFETDRKIDEKREFLINCIRLYANLSGREVRVIFFNGLDHETGAAFYFKRDDEWQSRTGP